MRLLPKPYRFRPALHVRKRKFGRPSKEHASAHNRPVDITVSYQLPVTLHKWHDLGGFSVGLGAHLSVNVNTHSTASGPTERDVAWRYVEVQAGLLGFSFSARITWPKWQETREQYLHNRALYEAKWALVERVAKGQDWCGHSFGGILPRRSLYPVRSDVVALDGSITVLDYAAIVRCDDYKCHRDYYLTSEDMDFIETPAQRSGDRRYRS